MKQMKHFLLNTCEPFIISASQCFFYFLFFLFWWLFLCTCYVIVKLLHSTGVLSWQSKDYGRTWRAEDCVLHHWCFVLKVNGQHFPNFLCENADIIITIFLLLFTLTDANKKKNALQKYFLSVYLFMYMSILCPISIKKLHTFISLGQSCVSEWQIN